MTTSVFVLLLKDSLVGKKGERTRYPTPPETSAKIGIISSLYEVLRQALEYPHYKSLLRKNPPGNRDG